LLLKFFKFHQHKLRVFFVVVVVVFFNILLGENINELILEIFNPHKRHFGKQKYT